MYVNAPRRTQAERTEATRALLLDTALTVLLERGWAATTAVEVCTRAGVTRGALVHHFGTLPALLAALLESLHLDYEAEVAAAAPTDLLAYLDTTWAIVSKPTFKAVLEAWWAAANDPALAASLEPVIDAFASLVSPANRPGGGRPDPEVTAFYLQAREAMLGLAFGRALSGGRPLGHEGIVLDRIRAEAAELGARAR
jgi:AcrR family transcriptional regulator